MCVCVVCGARCFDKCDATSSGCQHTCDELVNTMGYSCDDLYCPTCTYAGWCDKTCGFGDACGATAPAAARRANASAIADAAAVLA